MPMLLWALLVALPEPLLLGHETLEIPKERAAPAEGPKRRNWHTEAHARASRMAIGRFWGLGPKSRPHQESSYSRAHTSVTLRLGHPTPAVFHNGGRGDLGVRLLASYDALYGSQSANVPSIRS